MIMLLCSNIQIFKNQYNTIQYNTIQYNTIQYNTIQFHVIPSALDVIVTIRSVVGM